MHSDCAVVKREPKEVFDGNKFYSLKSQIVNTLSKNKLTIAQTRYLFDSILEQFETRMPVTNDTD